MHHGLGLGLSIVKTLVEMHGGTVRASSKGEGQGTTFIIQLPVGAAERGEAEEKPVNPGMSLGGPMTERERPSLRGVKVLVVDDELDAREALKRFLAKSGSIVAVTASAADAQKLLLKFEPDVIVSDIGMPQMDGYEFIREVRKQGITTPALALSAYVRAEDRIRSAQSGYQSHLGKPVEMTQLLAVIVNLAGK